MERGSSFSAEGFIKINVHAFNLSYLLPNGNDSRMGIVLRDHRGATIRMYSGMIKNLTPRANEIWPMLIGLQGAFFEQKNRVELETNRAKDLKGWEDWRWFISTQITEGSFNSSKKEKRPQPYFDSEIGSGK